MKEKNVDTGLIAKYISGECSEKEAAMIGKWLDSSDENRKEYNVMKKIDDLSKQKEYTPDIDAALKKVHAKLPEQLPEQRNYLPTILKIAAVFIIGAVTGFLVIPQLGQEKFKTIANNQIDSKPLEVELPDGSSIWLTHKSWVSFPAKFDKKERRILFEGQGYFDVTSNKQSPFIIETEKTLTTVLGTEFLLKAFPADSIKSISVTEGSVSFQVQLSTDTPKVILKAGEEAIYDYQLDPLWQQANRVNNLTSLKTGILEFDNTSLDQVLSRISDQYNKSFEILVPNLENEAIKYQFNNLTFEQITTSLEVLLTVEIEEVNGVYQIKEKS